MFDDVASTFTSANRADLDRLLKKQYRVVTRAQALGAGMTHSALRHRLRDGGPWQTVLPGVYLAVTGSVSVDQREMAAMLYGGPGSMVTGLAALWRHGIRAPRPDAVDVLVPAGRLRHDSGFVRLHRTKRMPTRIFTLGELRYAPPARAVADAARLMTDIRDVRAIVADSVQCGKCSPKQLAEELSNGPLRDSALLRQVLGEIADGIRSVAEAELRDLIKRSGLPGPVLFNAELYSGSTLIAIPDCWWPDAAVAVEVDSRQWHLSPADWERTMSRRARMSSYGIVVLHFSPRQIRTEPAKVVGLIRSALESAAHRPPLAIKAVPAA
jgi:very-short-patch-repair endonuclease